MELPKCQKCNNGLLIPLSDYGQEGSSVMFKAWVCTNPECGFSLRVDKGEVTFVLPERLERPQHPVVSVVGADDPIPVEDLHCHLWPCSCWRLARGYAHREALSRRWPRRYLEQTCGIDFFDTEVMPRLSKPLLLL